MKPVVSVVMPVWNAAETVGKAIQSILSQTFHDLELIIIDDGSGDATPQTLQQYTRKDARVQLERQDRAGIVAALVRGRAMARGQFIARMDADDVAMPTRLEKQLALFRANAELGLCGTGVRMIGEIGDGRVRYADWINGLTTNEDIFRERFVECPIAHPAFMMPLELYDAIGGYRDEGWAEDYDLFLRAAAHGARFANVAEPLLEWRESAGRLSMNDGRYSPEAFRACKRHYLRETVLADGRAFYQWGAGDVGKAWLREWGNHAPAAVVDINPRKIGKAIHGIKVIAPDDLPNRAEAFTLVSVGAPGARDEIRAWFGERGYSEEADYLFIA